MMKSIQFKLSCLFIILNIYCIYGQQTGTVIEQGTANVYDENNFEASGGYLKIGRFDDFSSHLSIDSIGIQSVLTEGGHFPFSLLLNPYGGDVGIGTQFPFHALDVNGNINTNGKLLANGVAGTIGQVLTSDTSGNISWTTLLTGDTDWMESGDDIYKLNGAVGIGTTDPQAQLHISNPFWANLDIESPLFSTLNFKSGTTLNMQVGFNSEDGFVLTNKPNGKLHLGTESQLDMTIIPGGNVGIGTEDPSYELDVVGDINATGKLLANSIGIGVTNPIAPLEIKGNPIFGTLINVAVDNYTEQSEKYGIISRAINTSARGTGIFTEGGRYGIHSRIPTSVTPSGGPFSSTAIYAENNAANGLKYAIQGISSSAGQGIKYGVFGNAQGSSSSKFGVYGSAQGNAGSKYGVYGVASDAGGANYAIYGRAANSTSNYAGYFLGNVNYTGTLTNVSDKRLKKNIQTISNTLKTVLQLSPAQYQYRNEEYKNMSLSGGDQLGFIAQEVEKILPGLVFEEEHEIHDIKAETGEFRSTEKINIKSLNYIGFIPILTGAIQEQQKIINTQESKLSKMNSELNSLREEMMIIKELLQKE